MLAHQATHQNLVFTCKTCAKKFNTKPNLNQHEHGSHGAGWQTPCGINVDWPQKLSPHKKCCSKCKRLIQQEEKKDKKLVDQLAKQQ